MLTVVWESVVICDPDQDMEVSQLGSIFVRVPMIWCMEFEGPYWGPLFMETNISYHIKTWSPNGSATLRP